VYMNMLCYIDEILPVQDVTNKNRPAKVYGNLWLKQGAQNY